MSDLTIGVLSAFLATNQPQAVSNLVQQQTGISVVVPDANDPEEIELRQLMISDDDALAEVGDWTKTNTVALTNTAAMNDLNRRIRERLSVVSDGYKKFLRNHPNNAQAYLAYGSFLGDTGNEDDARVQYENSRQLDPKNPAVWNNLANYYGENGELTNAFADYTEAIRLDPSEPTYYRNFATTVYLYRKDAKEFYKINEGQVFDKALGLYQQAMKLDPSNLVLASDYAESYYGIRPMRTNDALVAWTNVLNLSKDDNEREAAIIHLARVKIAAGFYDEAQAHLDSITNPVYAELKGLLGRSLINHKNPPPEVPPVVSTNLVSIDTNQPAIVTNTLAAVTNLVSAATNLVASTTNQVGTNAVELMAGTNLPPLIINPPTLEVAPPASLEQKQP